MKNQLFASLEQAEYQVSQSLTRIRSIHESRAIYNEIVSVPYEHKAKVSGFGIRTNWVCDREIRYRTEVRFNQTRFNEDLAAARNELQKAQQQLFGAEQAIRHETDSNQSQINYCGLLQGEVNSLQSMNNAMQSRLTHLGVNSWNATTQVHYVRQLKQNLANQKAKYISDLNELPSRVQRLDIKINNQKAQAEVLRQQSEQTRAEEGQLYKAVQTKLMDLDEIQRAVLAYDNLIKGNDLLLQIIETCGFLTEKAAEIAVNKGNQEAFNYCLSKGLKYDTLVSKTETLGMVIIKSGNSFFIDQLFSAPEELKLTIYIACGTNEFEVLESILKHDKTTLQKFKDVDACGFGVVQYAIASSNQSLLEFIIKQDIACFRQEVVGHYSYFSMALTYNDPVITQLISEQVNLMEELAYLVESQEVEMLCRAISSIELSVKDKASLLKLCTDIGHEDIAEVISTSLGNIEEVFIELLENGDLELASNLKIWQHEVLSFEYDSSLVQECSAELSTHAHYLGVEETDIDTLGEVGDQLYTVTI